jgi:NitT/TauT family transport system substrate-binding protein
MNWNRIVAPKLNLHAGAIALAAIVAIAAAIAFGFEIPGSTSGPLKHTPSPAKLAIGVPPVPSFANIILAQELGFFRDEGLEVTIKPYPTGAAAFADMLAGKLDIAATADTPIALLALGSKRFEVLATTFESGSFLKMVARRDRGITKPSDLAGKKLGVTFGTTAEFTQDSILAVGRVDPASVVRVNLAPARAVDALLSKEVDVVTIWAPYSRELIEKLNENAIVIGDHTISMTTINLVAPQGMTRRQPEEMRRMLAAVARATTFLRTDPDRAVRMVSKTLGLSESIIKADLAPADFTLALSQSLVTMLEDQARWAIKRRLVETKDFPNFTELIQADALAAVKPDAVSLIR